MKELIGATSNRLIILNDKGEAKPQIEVVIITSEAAYSLGEKGEPVRGRTADHFRTL